MWWRGGASAACMISGDGRCGAHAGAGRETLLLKCVAWNRHFAFYRKFRMKPPACCRMPPPPQISINPSFRVSPTFLVIPSLPYGSLHAACCRALSPCVHINEIAIFRRSRCARSKLEPVYTELPRTRLFFPSIVQPVEPADDDVDFPYHTRVLCIILYTLQILLCRQMDSEAVLQCTSTGCRTDRVPPPLKVIRSVVKGIRISREVLNFWNPIAGATDSSSSSTHE